MNNMPSTANDPSATETWWQSLTVAQQVEYLEALGWWKRLPARVKLYRTHKARYYVSYWKIVLPLLMIAICALGYALYQNGVNPLLAAGTILAGIIIGAVLILEAERRR